MIGSYRGIIFRLTHNFCALHFVQVPQLCGHLAVIAGQRQTKGLQHKADVPFPCLILIGCSLSPCRIRRGQGFPRPFRALPDAIHNFRAGAKSRQKLAAPRSNPPHGTGNCAPTLTSNTSKASSASMGSQITPGWTPPPGPRAHDITGLADSDMSDFFRSAPHAGPRSHGCAAGLRFF